MGKVLSLAAFDSPLTIWRYTTATAIKDKEARIEISGGTSGDPITVTDIAYNSDVQACNIFEEQPLSTSTYRF